MHRRKEIIREFSSIILKVGFKNGKKMKKGMVWKAKKEDQASCLNLNLLKQGCGFIGSF
jgi:streptomycin 6-kinase